MWLCVAVVFLSWRHVAAQNDLSSVEAAGEHLHQWLLALHAREARPTVLASQGLLNASVSGVVPKAELKKALASVQDLLQRRRRALQRLVSALEDASTSFEWRDDAGWPADIDCGHKRRCAPSRADSAASGPTADSDSGPTSESDSGSTVDSESPGLDEALADTGGQDVWQTTTEGLNEAGALEEVLPPDGGVAGPSVFMSDTDAIAASDDNTSLSAADNVTLVPDASPARCNVSLAPDPVMGGLHTSRTSFGVHIPVEVYRGYTEIVNGVLWSECVDQVFRRNAEEDGAISWQYFAAAAGYTRFFPATEWPVPPELLDADLYDARRRPWYTRGSTLPKDIVILMDRSGSMHGQTFSIMKFSVKALINTLGEDDFVNVAVFNSTVSWILNCSHPTAPGPPAAAARGAAPCTTMNSSLFQASTDNKLRLYRAIDAAQDGGTTNYSTALEFAYHTLLHDVSSGRKRGNCHRLVLIFSDGGTDQAQDIIDRYRNKSATTNVRIFTYAMGPHPIPTVVLKQMACQTGGAFTTITSFSGVRTLIQGYIHHLAVPPPPDDGPPPPPTLTPHIDVLTERVTVALTAPVYNRSAQGDAPPLLGVAGVDIPVTELDTATFSETLGIAGYFFMGNHNGFLTMHPRLRSQHIYLQDPPNRDLLELEWPSAGVEVVQRRLTERRRETHTEVRHDYQLIDARHLIAQPANFTYWVAPLNGTTHSLGMLVRNNGPRHVHMPPLHDPTFAFDAATVLLPPFVLPGGGGGAQAGLAWAQRWTEALVMAWRAHQPAPLVHMRVAFTRFGLTRHMTRGAWPEWLDGWRDPRHNPSLRRAEFGEPLSVFPTPRGALLTRPVAHKGLVIATVGLHLRGAPLRDAVVAELGRGGLGEQVTSLLLDDGGFVVVSQLSQLSSGDHLTEVAGGRVLLDQLVMKTVYKTVAFVDYQAVCGPPPPPPPTVVNAGGVLRGLLPPPSLALLLSGAADLLQLLHQLYWAVASLVVGVLVPPAAPLTEYGIAPPDRVARKPCTLRRTLYTWGAAPSANVSVSCGAGRGEVLASRLQGTNLLLVGLTGCIVDRSFAPAAPPHFDRDETFDPTSNSTLMDSSGSFGEEGASSAPTDDEEAEEEEEKLREELVFNALFAAKNTSFLPLDTEEITAPCCQVRHRRFRSSGCKEAAPQSTCNGAVGPGARLRGGAPRAVLLACAVTALLAARPAQLWRP